MKGEDWDILKKENNMWLLGEFSIYTLR